MARITDQRGTRASHSQGPHRKKLFFKLRSAKSKIAAFESGDLHPDQVALIAKSFDVTNQDVVDMNRRLGGDKSINAPLREDGETGEWQDHLVDQSPSPEAIVVEQDEKETTPCSPPPATTSACSCDGSGVYCVPCC
jgi:DNA-directed RNA polymerase sigma subunit (sigma70/sigma32)